MGRNAAMNLFIARECDFSPCRKYRYTLSVAWDHKKPIQPFIGLNPSTADETKDDPTVRKCIKWSLQWGAGGFLMLNLFAWRDTDPRGMLRAADPIGEKNTAHHLVEYVSRQAFRPPVAAWGRYGWHRGQAGLVHDAFLAAGIPLCCMRVNKDGSPEHPLYLPNATTPTLYMPISAMMTGF